MVAARSLPGKPYLSKGSGVILGGMDHRVYGKTDVGRRYDHNEDAMLIDPELGLYIVCDGVGGQAAGEVASQTASQTIRDYIAERRDVLESCRKGSNLFNRDRALDLAREAIEAANKKVGDMSATESDKQGMACTVVLVLILGPHAVVAHAGDSRIYLVRQGEIFQLTEDHSAANEQLKKGLITPEQARASRTGSLITRAIGIQRDYISPDLMFMELMRRDSFLICSDGLSRYFEDAELLRFFQGMPAEQLPDALVERSNKRGGQDNITAIVIEADKADAQSDAEVVRKFDILKKIPLFEYLNYMELMKILNITGIASYKSGDAVIREGERDHRLFVCLHGAVEVTKNGEPLAQLGTGDFFGEMSLIDKSPRSADVTATERCSLIIIDREHYFRLITREPRLAVKLMWPMCRELNRRLRDTSAELAWRKSNREGQQDDIEDALHFLST